MCNHARCAGEVGTTLLCLTLAILAASATAAPVDADLLLRGGTIHDGSGAQPVVGDVAVRDGRIVAVGKVAPGQIGRAIDCRGLVVAPGLIDLHTHTDGTLDQPGVRPALNCLIQGCTTMVTGNCGGARDVGKFLEDVDANGAGTNIAHLVGHGTVRGKVLGSARRAPTAAELERMKALVDQAMRDGAWGMSTGLIYAPGSYAETDELIALARVVAAHGGIYATHIRDEGDHLLEAVAEAIRIGRESGAPVEISHFKSMQIPNWGRIRDAAAMIEQARARGLKVTADQYPYTANSFSLADAALPAAQIQWCKRADLGKRMASDPEFAALVRRVIADQLGRTEKIVIAASKSFPNYVGKSLKDIAAQEKIETVDLVLKIVAQEAPQIVSHSMSEDDVRWAMALPWVATASDGAARTLNPSEHHHPRNFGTFARKIGRYAIQDKVLSLPQAIRSATGLPADIFGLTERGYLRPGYHADIVVFDPAVYRDQATFDKPQEYAIGVRYVFLGGQTAVDDSRPSAKLLGRALRHRSAEQPARAEAEGPMIDNTHDRVQTALRPGLKRIGTLKPRGAREVGRSFLAIGCEMLDRDYGDFEQFKAYIEPLGIKRIRLQAGWAKTEKVQGVYDFAWLDRQVDYLCAQGMDVLLETSYGNPLYPGGGGASLSDGLPTGEVALAAWDAWITALARHYQGKVRDWSTWNEPSNCKTNTPELVADNNIRTAEIIKRHIPDARIAGLVIGSPNVRFAEPYLKTLNQKGKTGLFHWMIYHDYSLNPDAVYPRVEEFVRIIHQYAPGVKIWQGEAGATSSPHYSAKISSAEWNSELTQCKWDARRMIGDLGHGIESLVFTFYDPAYDHPERYTQFVDPLWIRTRQDRFMKRMGLVKCNEDGKVLKVKPAYYTVQNIASVFDSSLEPVTGSACDLQCAKTTAAYLFRKKGGGQSLLAFWDCSSNPENASAATPAQITLKGVAFHEPVWVDTVTGAIYELPGDRVATEGGRTVLKDIPLYDAPALLTDKSVVVY